MKKLLAALGLFLASAGVGAFAHAGDITINMLPAGTAAASGAGDGLPYWDNTAHVTKRVGLWDLINLPPMTTTYAPLASPVFTGTLTAPTISATTLGVSGVTTLATMSTSGLATLNSLTVSGTSTLGVVNTSGLLTPANLTVPGTSNLVTENVSGTSTINNLSVTGTATLSNPLGVLYGGSGVASHTAYTILAGGTTATGPVQSLSAGLAGQILTSGGAGALPTWQSAPPPSFSGLQTDGIMYAISAVAIDSIAPGSANQFLMSQGGAGSPPTWTSSIGSGNVVRATSPTISGLTGTGATALQGASTLGTSGTNSGGYALGVQGNTTAGQSFGEKIFAGTNASDLSFQVVNATNTTMYFQVGGDGNSIFGGNVTLGLGGSTSYYTGYSNGNALWKVGAAMNANDIFTGSSAGALVLGTANGVPFQVFTASTKAMSIDASQNAQFAGIMGVSGSPLTGFGIAVNNTTSTAGSAGVYAGTTYSGTVTTARDFYSGSTYSGAITNWMGLRIDTPFRSGSGTITRATSINMQIPNNTGISNYAYISDNLAFTGGNFISQTGTDPSTFGGTLNTTYSSAGPALYFADVAQSKIQLNGQAANKYSIEKQAAVNGGDALFKFVAGATSAGEFGFFNGSTQTALIDANGLLLANNSVPLRWKDSGGTSRRVALVSGTNDSYFGPLDVSWGANTYLSAGTAMNFRTNGNSGTFLTALSIDTNATSLFTNNTTTVGTVIVQNTSSSTSSDVLNSFQIIKGSATTSSSQHFIGFYISSGTANGYIGGNGANSAAFFNTSDRRLKTNIESLPSALDKIMALRPVSFDWKSGEKGAVGFIAQELAKVLPKQVNKTDSGEGDELPKGQEPWHMTESGMTPYLVRAIQELKSEFDAYKASHP